MASGTGWGNREGRLSGLLLSDEPQGGFLFIEHLLCSRHWEQGSHGPALTKFTDFVGVEVGTDDKQIKKPRCVVANCDKWCKGMIENAEVGWPAETAHSRRASQGQCLIP